MAKLIEIKVGEMAIGDKDTVISTNGIGSCVAVCVYDPIKKVGGMIHAMLPTRIGVSAFGSNQFRSDDHIAKYVDEGIKRLVEEVRYLGGKKDRIVAKLVGGSRMFKYLNDERTGIGPKNIEMAHKILGELNVPIESEDIGGTTGRMAEFNLDNFILSISIKI